MENDLKSGSGRRSRRGVISVLLVLLLLTTGVSALLFIKYQRALGSNPSEERQQIISKIEHVVLLPNEDPSLSTVVDSTKFTNQTLRDRAKNGDKLLIYAEAKRLVIYRPATQKVVDLLTIQEKQPTTAASPAEKNP